MKGKRLWIASILMLLLGGILCLLGITGRIDSYWNGMGMGLLIVGVLRFVQQIRYQTDADYRENKEINATDERNRFLAMKAWSWAGYLYVMIAAVGSIACKLLGREDLMMFCSMSVCLILVLYWVSYVVLKRKY